MTRSSNSRTPAPPRVDAKTAESGAYLAVRPSLELVANDADLAPERIEAQIERCRRLVASARRPMAALGQQHRRDVHAIEQTRPALAHSATPARFERLGDELEDLAESLRRSRRVIDSIGEDLVKLHADSIAPRGK